MTYHFPVLHSSRTRFALVMPTMYMLCDPSLLYSGGIERHRGEMLLSCSDKVSNITISPSSLKNCYKPISKIAAIYSVKTVSSSQWQCKLLGWIMPVSFRGVYQRGSITQRPKSEIGQHGVSLPPDCRQLVCCHGTACCYCSGHKMVPSHTTTWQHWKLFNSRHRNTMWNTGRVNSSTRHIKPEAAASHHAAD